MLKRKRKKHPAFKDLAKTMEARPFEVELLSIRKGASLMTAAGIPDPLSAGRPWATGSGDTPQGRQGLGFLSRVEWLPAGTLAFAHLYLGSPDPSQPP